MDKREHKYCAPCRKVIDERPHDVLFGIQINTNGDVFFLMNNRQWFDKIFKSDSYGVTVDIVSKDRYACNLEPDANFALPKGTMLLPIYRSQILKDMDELTQGHLFVKIGKVPAALRNKELEGNLVIVNGNYICYYSNFVNINRNIWQLLPMGLFTDSLLNNVKTNKAGDADYFTYTKKVELQIAFSKGSTTFSDSFIKNLSDSLQLTSYRIQQIDIRAFSSVEGPEQLNKSLMTGRADAMVQALKSYTPSLQRVKVLTAENWLEFFKDIEDSRFSELLNLSRAEIKRKLTDQALVSELEPLLAKHRKVVATIYLEINSTETVINDSSILGGIQKAVSEKDIDKARALQKELVNRIIDKKLPPAYIDKIEVPQSKEFSPLLNDREVYKYLLKATDEYEALENFLVLQQLDPGNGRINYNICALRFFTWQYGGDSLASKILLKEINALSSQGIGSTLIKRMLINYYILKCEDQLRAYNYAGKDSSISIIRSIYEGLKLNDEEIYSLARYYSFYAHQDWAKEIIAPRIDKVDISEDLVFYYVNLLFFHPSSYDSDDFHKASLNAISLNRKRFCDFLLPNDKGGASMQLLDYEQIKTLYCEHCK